MSPESVLVHPALVESAIRKAQNIPCHPALLLPGNGLPVLLTCAHGVAHLREGRIKPADSGTLAFAMLLAELTGASLLLTSEANLPDSNHHVATQFKQALLANVGQGATNLVVDLHGSHYWRPYDLDEGSLDGVSWRSRPAFREALRSRMAEANFILGDNSVFKAQGASASAETVTAFVHRWTNVPAVQVEISSAYLGLDTSPLAQHRSMQLANALALFIRDCGKAQ